MASLKIVQNRLRSVGSIQKITSAMKMVSAAKFKHDEKRMLMGTPFAQPVVDFFDRLPEGDASALNQLTIVPLASDKGLCGAINSAVAKITRNMLLEEEGKGSNVEILCCGNKSYAALKRLYGDRFQRSLEGTQVVPFNFANAALIAERVNESDPQRATLVHNKFRNMASYDTDTKHLYTKKEVKSLDKTEWSKVVDQYNFEPATMEVWEDLHEFYYAAAIFGQYLSGIAAEQSARMAAMENASSNCGEMMDKLQLQFNRARQAKITTELCEIISGASAV